MSWGYALNQWKPSMDAFVRRERHERVFKTLAACGFTEIELRAGTGRWEVLGHPVRIADSYGSVEEFGSFVRSCGLERVAAIFLDPEQPFFEELSFGRSTADPSQRDAIVALSRVFAELLQELGGSTLVVRPVGSYWRTGPLDDGAVQAVAETWNAVGGMTAELGIRTALHVDCFCALQTAEDLARLLELTDPAAVDLALDTGELALACLDPVALVEQHAARIGHVHLKDVDVVDHEGGRLQPLAERELFSDRRIFWELGQGGGVDFAALLEALARHGYAGSLVVECEGTPDPALSAMLSGWYLKQVDRQTA